MFKISSLVGFLSIFVASPVLANVICSGKWAQHLDWRYPVGGGQGDGIPLTRSFSPGFPDVDLANPIGLTRDTDRNTGINYWVAYFPTDPPTIQTIGDRELAIEYLIYYVPVSFGKDSGFPSPPSFVIWDYNRNPSSNWGFVFDSCSDDDDDDSCDDCCGVGCLECLDFDLVEYDFLIPFFPPCDEEEEECPDLNLTIRGTLLPARRGTARVSGDWCK